MRERLAFVKAYKQEGDGMRIIICSFLSMLTFSLATSSMSANVQTKGSKSPEYKYFAENYWRRNPNSTDEQLNAAFRAISDEYDVVRRTSPDVTLGAMISLVLFESQGRERYFNTRDAENSFKGRLDKTKPFADQPLARYSYQLGIVPIHTSNLRPCMKGTQAARAKFDGLVTQKGLAPTREEIERVRPEFDVVCKAARTGHIDGEPDAADYFILNAHGIFKVPANSSGSAPLSALPFPFFDPSITAPVFFRALEAKKALTDATAICEWGGNDKSYCDPTKKQVAILSPWRHFQKRN